MPFICEGAYRKDRYDRCDCPHALLKLTDGKYRLFLYNPERERYRPVSVISKKGIIDAQVISYYPILPVKFNNCSTDQGYVYKYSEESESALPRDFSTKIKPNGITVIDITLSDDSIKNSTV
jgi:hypothetical protein